MSGLGVALEACPFCGSAMKVSAHPVNQWAVCPTDGCIGARQTIVLEDPKQVAAWNRRAKQTASVEGVGRAIAGADGEDYMEDYKRYDERARAAIKACGLVRKP